MDIFRDRFTRTHLLSLLSITCVTAYFSYAYFHIDEYAQVLLPALLKLGAPAASGLTWEFPARMRPWMQAGGYFVEGRILGLFGVRDVFALSFAFRLASGLVGWVAVCAFVQTSSSWFHREEERRTHIRVATLLGFLPYLLVRTSQESLSGSAFTLGWSLLLLGASPNGPIARPSRPILLTAGALFGLAFEFRFQTALLVLGSLAWLRVIGRLDWRALATVSASALLPVALALQVDRWGYGEWVLPPLEYVRTNILEGAAGIFGSDPPFAYVYMEPANIFFPVVLLLLLAMVLAWYRHPTHAVTWATMPFFLIHCLVAHKEERFLFPMAILATSFVSMAFAPGYGRPISIAPRAWSLRRGAGAKAVVAVNFAGMGLLALYPLGWHHHVPFDRFVREDLGGNLQAYAFEDFELAPPPFAARTYDIEKVTPAQIVGRREEGRARQYLVADTPRLRTGEPRLDAHSTLLYSEFVLWRNRWITEQVMGVVDAYNERTRAPLHRIRWRSLYRIEP